MSNDLFRDRDKVPALQMDYDGAESLPTGRHDPLGPRYDRRPKRGLAWLAWIVVLGLTGYMMFNSLMVQRVQKKTVEIAKGELLQSVFMGKVALGLKELSATPGAESLADQSQRFIKKIDSGTIEQRFCYAIMIAEIENPENATKALSRLKAKTSQINLAFNENQTRLWNVLTAIFSAGNQDLVAEVTEEDKAFLKNKLPWFGNLALNHQITRSAERAEILARAKNSIVFTSSFIAIGIAMLCLGVVFLLISSAKILAGSFRQRVYDDSRYGAIYIETFAIWFLLFLGISIGFAFAGNKGMGISSSAVTMLLPLVALFWPVLRGVPNQHLLDDTGLRLNNPLKEVAAGIFAYIAMTPVLLLSMLVSFFLMGIMSMVNAPPNGNEFSPTGVPHPIANEAFAGEPLTALLTIVFIAAVLAPLTEEVMFRGVLFRSMRDGSSRMARWASIAFAALFSSLIFAAIHPQGIAGIPVLTTLAVGFCLVRQWRGSLIAPIVMHAIHNGFAICMLIPLLF